ncbi:ribonuclease J [Ructibacterium gallinarum]|uniref:Ribonuclease J n=1 Tax=Ructibacterium gallinarum TaxID=2779355 RepID=A0A9D5R919_9FIRM|nr:ribonuclease J [Ructibacterium gallinarum]MBE5040014.1 ribonuclease J [Ructibacterium gallinarum]
MLKKSKKIRVIPLGGLNEIGKNLTVFEYGNDVVILDCGMAFPDDDMLGVDIVIPDITYLHKVANKIRGIVLTHGHEDHIGAIPYVLKEFNVPVYGTRLTLGILKNKLKEHGLLRSAKLNTLEAGESVRLGEFQAEFIHTNHSIADAVAIALHTPAGVLLHTGDFKIDPTPIDGDMIDLARIGELGKKGILALFSDSTNADRPGYTMSESSIGKTFDSLFERGADKRIIVATFASNIHRVQQIINAAVKYGRKVAVSGRSMVNVLNAAIELGYMNIPKNTLIDIDEIGRYPKDKLVVVTTGSQGEEMSALTRIAFSIHKKINIEPTDLVIISANPIPGNEKAVSNVVNELLKHGAEVIHERQDNVHVSGHACQQEMKIIISLARPKYFIPVHGEYRHLCKHRELALQTGMDPKNIFIMDIGKVLELSQDSAKIVGTVPSGKVLVDGLGVGDVGNIVLRDRKHLAEDGIIIVVLTIDRASCSCAAGPDIISRGFVYVRESEDLMDAVKDVACGVVEQCTRGNTIDWSTLKTRIKNEVGGFLFSKTKRRPMILPIIMEV